MLVQQGTSHIYFDGRNPSLREFLQDIANGAVYMNAQTEPGLIKSILSKLKCPALESVRDKSFLKLDDLVKLIKECKFSKIRRFN